MQGGVAFSGLVGSSRRPRKSTKKVVTPRCLVLPATREVLNSGADQAAFCFAHLARWAAAIFARASGLIVFLFFRALVTDSAGEVEAAFFFAHLAFCAAAIFARAAADRLPFLPSTDFGLTCGTVPL